MSESIGIARDKFARREWAAACAAFALAGELTAADQEQRAVAAYLIGADEACERAWEAAHRAALKAGEPAEAARYSFWLGWCLMLRGQMAQAGGWLARTRSIIDETGSECPASGYLLIPEMLGALGGGDAAGARDRCMRGIEIAKRCGEIDLWAFAVLGLGQSLIALGDTAGGTARLDEVMVSVTAGEVGPLTAGIVYCAVILECMALLDLRRAKEWRPRAMPRAPLAARLVLNASAFTGFGQWSPSMSMRSKPENCSRIVTTPRSPRAAAF